MLKVTKSDFLKIVQSQPALCAVGLAPINYWTRPRKKTDFDSNRQEFIDTGFGEFEHACIFLSNCILRKTINRKVGTSYGIKHKAESWAGDYISNGALIAAAIHLGIHYEQVKDSPNVYLALSSKCSLLDKKSGR